MDKLRPTWLEIDLEAVSDNLRNIRKLIPQSTLMMTVVKANAFGHGSIPVSQTAVAAGADYLGVATLDEAVRIREAGIATPILILGAVDPVYYDIAIKNHIDLTIFDLASAELLSRQAQCLQQTAAIHLKIDTGMRRIGVSPDAVGLETVKAIHKLPGIKIRGVFTHFATADEQDKTYALQQLEVFKRFVHTIQDNGISGFIRHCANSASIIDLPEAHMDMVRAGIIIYGLYPSAEVHKERLPLKPVISLKTTIVHVKKIKLGQSVSYGRRYICPEEQTIATVPIGYADGYNRALSNRAPGVLKGRLIRQVGTICMDQTMFDVSSVPEAKVGDVIVLFGDEQKLITIDHLAALLNTINYEIVCMMGERVYRTYK